MGNYAMISRTCLALFGFAETGGAKPLARL
jgi:hypothetical protein